MFTRNTRQAQNFFAARAFFVDMRFAIATLIFAQYKEALDGSKQFTKALIFHPTLVYVA